MKAWDSDTFYAIQDAVCDWFAKYNNTTLEHLIEMRQAEYTEKEGKTCSYQEAKDEVTCNAIEAIQTAENFAEEFTQTMADLQYPKAEAEGKLTALQSFFRKIKLALNNILTRIRNKRSGDLMITAEGKTISKDVAMVNDLLKKVRQGLVNVRTNYDSYVAGAEVKSAEGGKVRKMYGDDNSVISAEMSDNERYVILKNKKIFAPVYEGEADDVILEELDSRKHNSAKKAILAIADKLGVIGTEINFDDVEVKITLSNSNLKESFSKEATPKQIAKLLPLIVPVAETSVLIERHNNRYYYDTDTVYFDNLLGGYIDGKQLVPVRFGLKHSGTGNTTLYVVVDQNAVERRNLDEIKNDTGHQAAAPESTGANKLRRRVTYSLSQIIQFVNSKDVLRYIPDNMLNEDQHKAKWEAIADTIQRTNDKNDKRYIDYISKGNLRDARAMVIAKAKDMGFTIKAYHGTPIKGITVFDSSKIGTTTDEGIFGHGFYFTTNKLTADGYATADGETIPVFLKVEQPWWGLGHEIDEVAEQLNLEKSILTLRKVGRNSVVAPLTRFTGTFTAKLKENGYNSVIIQHGQNDYEIVVFDNTNIKSADTITYDNDGNIIPLSKRFDVVNRDIRYQHISSEADEQAKADELEALREENKAFKAKGTGDGKVKKMHGETTDFGTTSEDEEKSIKKQIRKNSEALNSMGVLVELNETETFANKTKQESKEWILSELEKRGIEKIIHREGFGDVIFDEKRIKKGYRYFKKNHEKLTYFAVPEIIKNGIEIGYHPKHKNRPYDTITFGGPVKLNGIRGNMAVVVRIEDSTHYYKVHRLMLPDGTSFVLDEKRDNADRAGAIHSESHLSPTDIISTDRIPQNKQIVKGDSPTDSDSELKQHISSEEEEQAKADELDALREENKALKAMDKRRWQMIDYLQRQLEQWKRGGKKLDYRGIEKLARSLIKEYGAKVDVKAYAKELTGFFNYMTNNSKPSADVIKKRYTELAEKLIHNVEAVNPEVQEQLKNIRHIIREGIVLNVNQRGDVLHRFETMAKYREKVGNSVKITSKGIPLDDVWKELSAMYPDLFPEDTTDADQPIVMARALKEDGIITY